MIPDVLPDEALKAIGAVIGTVINLGAIPAFSGAQIARRFWWCCLFGYVFAEPIASYLGFPSGRETLTASAAAAGIASVPIMAAVRFMSSNPTKWIPFKPKGD